MSSRRPASRPLLLLVWVLAHAGAAPAEEATETGPWWEEALDQGGALLESVLSESLTTAYRLPTREDWDLFWTSAQSALGSEDPTAMAALDPYVHDALGMLDAVPSMSPYADWLRQRLDYFEVAADLSPPPPVTPPKPSSPPRPTGPSTGRVPPPPARQPTWPRVTPPAPRPPVSAPPVARAKVPPKARHVDYWSTRLAARQVPADRTAVIPRLKAIFREEGVPESLVWMAETESTLNPLARSPAGAAGLFQFMPATATRFGLSLSPTDDRLVPDKSARAAAQYLKMLNGRFKDWPLAIAAYNAGEGRVDRALSRSGARTFESVADHLPSETQMYVPKVLATIELREGRPFDPNA